MRTTRAFESKCLQLTRAINLVTKQVTSVVGCAGFKDTGIYTSEYRKAKRTPATAAQIAAILNYGSPVTNLPPRPFMSRSIETQYSGHLTRVVQRHLAYLYRQEIQDIVKDFGIQKARRSKRASKAMADELSKYMFNAIHSEIRKANFSPLSPSYALARGKTHFLDKSDRFISLIQAWTLEDKDGVSGTKD